MALAFFASYPVTVTSWLMLVPASFQVARNRFHYGRDLITLWPHRDGLLSVAGHQAVAGAMHGDDITGAGRRRLDFLA